MGLFPITLMLLKKVVTSCHGSLVFRPRVRLSNTDSNLLLEYVFVHNTSHLQRVLPPPFLFPVVFSSFVECTQMKYVHEHPSRVKWWNSTAFSCFFSKRLQNNPLCLLYHSLIPSEVHILNIYKNRKHNAQATDKCT